MGDSRSRETGSLGWPAWDFSGSVVFVSGSSQGLGLEIARSFFESGASVVTASRSLESLQATWGEVLEHDRLLGVELDVRNHESIETAVAAAQERFGQLDVLVNNAAVPSYLQALEVTPADWDAVLDVNLRGAFFLTQQVVAKLVERGSGGRVVNLGSTFGVVGFPGRSLYGTSKGAITHMTKILAVEWAPHGITVNTVAPTAVETPSRARFFSDPERRQQWADRIPLQRFPEPRHVAEAVKFLASEAGAVITGHTLMVDGGWTAW